MIEHGVAEGTYVSNGTSYLPVIICLCGDSSPRSFSWAEAGEWMDEHIEETA